MSCSKAVPPRPSNDLLITVLNECMAEIKIYDSSDRQQVSDIYDCRYIKILPVKLVPGLYKIIAENDHERIVTNLFTKENFSQEITIEF